MYPVIEVNNQKGRLGNENAELNKKLMEFRSAMDMAGLDKNKVASQIKDLQSNMDNVSRQKQEAERRVVTIEQSMKTINIEVDELRAVRADLERAIMKWKEECMDWKKKYENEARLRIEDVDMLKKKFGAQIADLQDQLDSVLNKMKGLEQQKNRLQQEVTVLIKDLEVSQCTVKDLTARLAASERRAEDLAAKLREMTNLYEKADRDAKQRAQEIVRISNDFDRAKMENEGLRRDNGKLNDDCRSLKAELDALKKRFHELDMENRKLAHDREELARAYKDADNGRNKALSRVQELEAELANLRKDAERRLLAKDDELQVTRKKLMTEIEQLTIRLQEAEARLKNEVENIKKKMAVTIHELEMSLDAANKNNAGLQGTCKTQQTRIMELTSVYEDAQRKLADIEGNYGSVVQKIQIYEKEITVLKSELQALTNDKRANERQVQELGSRITQITNINNELTQVKIKLEKELQGVSGDYNDLARELKLADERANKAGHDAQHFESLARTEQSKVVQLENVKKALETEVRTLTVRMEEIETTAVSSSRMMIKKMETRIEELESLLDREKRLHLESASCLQKKERSVKELLLQSEEDRKNIIILQESLEKLNEKIKMYKRQLEEQESISNSNIMRVKKFQRELESAEARAVDAESALGAFRSRQRVFSAAESRRAEESRSSVEKEIVVKKVVHNVNVSGDISQASNAISQSSSSAYGSVGAFGGGSHAAAVARDIRAGSTALALESSSSALNRSAMESASSSSALRSAQSSSGYRAGSVYSRAGSMARGSSMARSSMARATSMGRSGSVLRY